MLLRYSVICSVVFALYCNDLFGQSLPQVTADPISLQLLPNEDLGITHSSPLVLQRTDPDKFQSPLFRVIFMENETVAIELTDTRLPFSEVAKRRKKTDIHMEGTSADYLRRFQMPGHLPSNVGVSLAVTTQFKNKNYALLTYRESEKKLMLLSGYVDSSALGTHDSASIFWSNVFKEASEELLLIGRDRLPLNLVARHESGFCAPVRQAYSSIAYSEHSMILSKRKNPKFLTNVLPAVMCDGQKLDACLQFARTWDSVQLIFSFELLIDESEMNFLFHAEDRLTKGKTAFELVTVLNRNGLVLAELDEDEGLSDRLFWLHDGQLSAVDFDLRETWLSEAFIPGDADSIRGLVESDKIRYSDYLIGIAER